VIGEGGSGGALALAVGDVVMMLENSIYSVITPEGCAAILWKDASKAEQAAENLRLTAQDLLELKVVDEVIPGAARGGPPRSRRNRPPGQGDGPKTPQSPHRPSRSRSSWIEGWRSI
jgi:acetyl-CoA carboxylase carboxyl transferase subunit alpha